MCYRYVLIEDIDGVGLFSVCDGHNGVEISTFVSYELTVFFKKKIEEAIASKNDTHNSKGSQCPDDAYYLNAPKMPALTERNHSFMEFYNRSMDCVIHPNCDVRDKYFDRQLGKILNSIRDTPLVKRKNYGPLCYIENNKINFNRMIQDEMYLLDYKSLKKARKMVCTFYPFMFLLIF